MNEAAENQVLRLHRQGLNNVQIGYRMNVSTRIVGTVLFKYGIGGKYYSKTEDGLINEHTKYAVDYSKNIKFERIYADGKWYIDITPLLCPK